MSVVRFMILKSKGSSVFDMIVVADDDRGL